MRMDGPISQLSRKANMEVKPVKKNPNSAARQAAFEKQIAHKKGKSAKK